MPTFPNLPKHGDNPSYFGSLKNGTENLEYQAESSLGASNTFLKFSAGFELHEALGPAFSKGCHYLENEAEKIESISISGMTCDSGSENLLEAVVGNLCYSGSDCISEKSCSKSSQSLLMSAEKTPNSSSHIEHMIQSSGRSMSSKGFSSNCPSGYSEQLDRHSVPAKSSKKRARPGENSKPRPRDRQLIQDRIKELRELVPNGAKVTFI